MNGKILTVLLVVSMVSVCIPAVFAIPDQPTKEEEKEIIEKYIERQSESKGWLNIPNRNSNPADEDDDIAPELWMRYQNGLTRYFNVEYNIQSTNSAFTASWSDEFWVDDDVDEWYVLGNDIVHYSQTLSPGSNKFTTGEWEAPKTGYLDMNIEIDVDNDIVSSCDNPDNNYDEEYMYFYYI